VPLVRFQPLGLLSCSATDRGSEHDSAKVVGEGSTPSGGTGLSFTSPSGTGSDSKSEQAVFDSLAACCFA